MYPSEEDVSQRTKNKEAGSRAIAPVHTVGKKKRPRPIGPNETVVAAYLQIATQATQAEKVLASALAGSDILYISQCLFEPHIVDFWIPYGHKPGGFVVEVDGPYHATQQQRRKDARRENHLKKFSRVNKILRFTNDEVLTNPEKIAASIKSELSVHNNDKCLIVVDKKESDERVEVRGMAPYYFSECAQ